MFDLLLFVFSRSWVMASQTWSKIKRRDFFDNLLYIQVVNEIFKSKVLKNSTWMIVLYPGQWYNILVYNKFSHLLAVEHGRLLKHLPPNPSCVLRMVIGLVWSLVHDLRCPGGALFEVNADLRHSGSNLSKNDKRSLNANSDKRSKKVKPDAQSTNRSQALPAPKSLQTNLIHTKIYI